MYRIILIMSLFIPLVIVASNLSEEKLKELTAQEKHHSELKKVESDLIMALLSASTGMGITVLAFTIAALESENSGISKILGPDTALIFAYTSLLAAISLEGYAIYKGVSSRKHLDKHVSELRRQTQIKG